MHPKSLRKEEIPHQTCPGREVNSHRIACSRMASICGGNQSLDKHEKSTNSDFLCQVSRAYLSWDINWFNMSANFQLLSFRHLASLLLSKNGPGSTTTYHSLGRRGMIMLEARLGRFITFPTNVTESVNFEYSCSNPILTYLYRFNIFKYLHMFHISPNFDLITHLFQGDSWQCHVASVINWWSYQMTNFALIE